MEQMAEGGHSSVVSHKQCNVTEAEPGPQLRALGSALPDWPSYCQMSKGALIQLSPLGASRFGSRYSLDSLGSKAYTSWGVFFKKTKSLWT